MGMMVDGVWRDIPRDTKSTGGAFVRPESAFRDRIATQDVEKGRYRLYVARSCPWAHRTIILRAMKGLEKAIPAFYTRTGYGTLIAEGKETRQFNGEWYVMEESLTADIALVKAYKADKAGNLVFNKTARNFNPLAAMAGKVCVVEVDHLVETGELDPDQIHLPGIYVQRIIHNPNAEKRIEKRTVRS